MYEYLSGNLIGLIIWFIFFLMRKDLRTPIIFTSLLVLPFAISDRIFIPTYWNPHTTFYLVPGIESFLYAFVLGGTAWGTNKVLLKMKLQKIQNYEKSIRYLVSIPLILMFFIMLLGFVNSFVGQYLIRIWIVGSFLVGSFYIYLRKDLGKQIIYGSAIYTILYTGIFLIFINILFPGIVQRVWNINNLIGLYFLGLPIEEILFAFSWSMMINHVYEIYFGYRLEKISD